MTRTSSTCTLCRLLDRKRCKAPLDALVGLLLRCRATVRRDNCDNQIYRCIRRMHRIEGIGDP
jgi:hypothetical protein